MKGISPVIATLLLLVITLGLIGLAYGYITGIFAAKTAVVLSIIDTTCAGDDIVVTVANDGTTTSGVITATATTDSTAGGSNTIASIGPGLSASTTIDRPAAAPIGTYTIKVTSAGVTPATGYTPCSTVGV